MCDYSLHTEPNRLARAGETLIVHRFRTGAKGLASPCELGRITPPQPLRRPGEPWWSWSVVKRWLARLGAPGPVATAVCIPPGARLILPNVPQAMREEYRIAPGEPVAFAQLSAEAYTYRDALCFESGRTVSLQDLPDGLPLKVLSLGAAEPAPQTVESSLV
jgi:hypothetical protein